jgi:signal transduction histidine kinase
MAGAADIMGEYWDRLTPDERAENIRNLTRSAARARRLLDDLLTASRLESGSIEFEITDVPLDAAIRDAVVAVGPALGPVEVVGATGVTVEADANRLGQMLTNFLSNAGRYGAAPVTVEVLPTGPTVEIRVCDHGPGVSEEFEGRMFRKFVRGTGRPDRGTGLGLFIVAEMARRQNGGVWYERRGDQTCFGFRLPAGRLDQP